MTEPNLPYGRSRYFPFAENPINVILEDQINSHQTSRHNNVAQSAQGIIDYSSSTQPYQDMGCQGQQYPLGPAIDFGSANHPTPSSSNDQTIQSQQVNQIPIFSSLPYSHNTTSHKATSKANFQNYTKDRNIVNNGDDEDEEGEEIPLEIELSEKSSYSPRNDRSKTTVISLKEFTKSPSSTIEMPLYANTPKIANIPPKRPHTSKFNTDSSSSSLDHEYIVRCDEPISTNGRYPTRKSTIRANEKVQAIRNCTERFSGSEDERIEAKKDKSLRKGQGKAKVGAYGGRRIPAGEGIYNDGTINRKAQKIPAGAFLFQLMEYLAYDKYPGYVIMKNQVAFIPNTEAFAKFVYSRDIKDHEKSKAITRPWESFQRNLNNYIASWPFHRLAVPGTKLKSQIIDIPTLNELAERWKEYGLDENVLERERNRIEQWAEITVPVKPYILSAKEKKTLKLVQFKRRFGKSSKLIDLDIAFKSTDKKERKYKIDEIDQNDEDEYYGPKKKRSRTTLIGESSGYYNQKEEKSLSVTIDDEEENNELYSEEDTEMMAPDLTETRASSPEIPLFNRIQANRMGTPEKMQLRLSIGGKSISIPSTPEKAIINSDKRSFASINSNSPDKGQHDPTYHEIIYTPSPTFSNPIVTPQTANTDVHSSSRPNSIMKIYCEL
ncbi:uncharacterized protein I206_106320 [Kwoniella pini CBS 10737]|uniref:Uncharacterized protein n=1 Tax=Kwoniella pini CBS 10737 TaxID=1296096 RepID=A0A1B9HTZ2_9TREE|nr:uncharacterized protein I206_07122 [Kwoniella pini CBS 10737]OCF46735.1 hypothetical protein I206_07122 [Kwoniella pini CBS 10737]